MQGGSLSIQPGALPASSSSFILQNIRVVVRDSTLLETNDAVVFDNRNTGTAPSTIQNIVMEIHNTSIITSTDGNLVSIVAARATIVRNVHIAVGGNTVLTTARGSLVASISANTVIDSSLIVDSGSCSGPVVLSAGDSVHSVDVGILSIVPRPHHDTFYLEDVRVLVSNKKNIVGRRCPYETATINFRAVAREGVAASAGVALARRSHSTMTLQMTGRVAIEVDLQEEDDVPSIGTQGSSSMRSQLIAYVAASFGSAAIGGLAMNLDASRIILHHCFLQLKFVSRQSIALTSTAQSRGGAATVFGVAVNSFSDTKRGLESTFLVANDSTVTIASSIVAERASVTASTEMSEGGAASVMAVALSSYSCSNHPHSTINITQRSHVWIASETLGDGDIVLAAKAGEGTAASTMGVAVNSFCDAPESILAVDTSSSLSVHGWVDGGHHLMARAERNAATSTMGITASASDWQGAAGHATAMVAGTVEVNAVVDAGALVENQVGQVIETGVATLGINIYGDGTGALLLLGTKAMLSLWIGCRNNATLSATGPASATVALSASTLISNASPLNTALTFCTDGSVDVRGGVSLGVSPQNTAVRLNTNNTWYPVPDTQHHHMVVHCLDEAHSVKDTILQRIHGPPSHRPKSRALSMVAHPSFLLREGSMPLALVQIGHSGALDRMQQMRLFVCQQQCFSHQRAYDKVPV